MNVLVLGGNGMLAREVKPALESLGLTVSSMDHRSCDITSPQSIDHALAAAQPDWVVNCAAWTKVDAAEMQVDAAFAVNATGAGNVARALRYSNASLVHVSTDYVFDGKKRIPYVEGDVCAPMGAYARSKHAGEEQVLDAGCRAFIVRTGELYGEGGPNFFDAIFRRARAGQPLKVVDDQWVSPTWTRELAGQIAALTGAAGAPPGTYHATCSGEVTCYDAAKVALRLASLTATVQPVTTMEFGSPTPRPLYTVLGHDALERLGLYVMRPWDVALQEWIAIRGTPS
jgi:dTDP-4-dehydrorhamnose reductase